MNALEVVQWINTQGWLKDAIVEFETRGKAGLDFFAAEKYKRIRELASDRMCKKFLMVKNRETALGDAIALWVSQNNHIPLELARLRRLIHGTDPVETPEEHLERIRLRAEYNRVSTLASRDLSA